MSSNPAAITQIEKAGFKLIRDVLRTAGLRGVEAEASSDMKRDALIFLTSEFRDGVRTKASLLEALTRRSRPSTVGARFGRSSKEYAIDRWRDEGGR
ncbi:hypothetical protein GCM10010924_48290 [Rhizobium wenxiniae]|uniref:Uncharacterized protein n=1 Tax=Rhizobium wenxiniae TaxID=1737357 RepID=A0A7X0D276_9HYPH|nr:hypothetical protein [Rhizobium wenxiniae]MBB6165189.1 hypothetical protein [Rhizobium wenxiniae]GGG13505.1 hypothetical protein GCM10010924_48290 [Rhizobium wenxiniae]